MTRDISEIQTTFSTDGADAVASALAATSERPFEPRCSDPAVCGSEWSAVHDIGSGTVAVICSRCGRTSAIDLTHEADE